MEWIKVNQATLTQDQQERLESAKAYIRGVLQPRLLGRIADTLPMTAKEEDYGRIYVGSIPYECTSQDVHDVFRVYGTLKEDILLTVDASTQRHRGFCFVAYECMEAARMALEEAKEMGGRKIKVARPSQWDEEGWRRHEEGAKELGRVYVAHVDSCIGENELEQVFTSFGKIQRIMLIRRSAEEDAKYGRCGFIQFEEVAMAETAALTLNRFTLGQKMMYCTLGMTPGDVFSGRDAETIKETPTSKEPTPSTLEVCMDKDTSNPNVTYVFNVAEEMDPALKDEFKEECTERFGPVQDVRVDQDPVRGIWVRVEFTTVESADKAQHGLHGRWFGGKQLGVARPGLDHT